MGLFARKPDPPKYKIEYTLKDSKQQMIVKLNLRDWGFVFGSMRDVYYQTIREIAVPLDAPEFENQLKIARDELIEYSEIREIALETSRAINGVVE